ncbi:hypothetical protein [Thioalkalivibrio sp. ALE28]|uniref:hypothetical protein n=1 Tax=Thioalkalivibrio sp. ALE28 TaxID=1158179 RepID=UPI0003602FA9|nr:hypothetical protein [Thioalkalivibrio sp. ALE28]
MNLEETEYTEEVRALLREAKGNWDFFPPTKIPQMEEAAREWASALEGIERPWLCWNVDEDWCRIQQRLVRSVGWTPVVGGDPRAGRPPLESGAIAVDFNARFDYPIMHFLFPIEFSHLFTQKIAFWHSDLVVRKTVMENLATMFENLPDGSAAAVDRRRGWYRRWRGQRGRFWELVACTTAGASRDQYAKGAGWWRNIWRHPNCRDVLRQRLEHRYDYDHGAGILAWHEVHGGNVVPIPHGWVEEGHCTRVGNSNYRRRSPQDERRDLGKDLSHNFDLREVCQRLGISDLL